MLKSSHFDSEKKHYLPSLRIWKHAGALYVSSHRNGICLWYLYSQYWYLVHLYVANNPPSRQKGIVQYIEPSKEITRKVRKSRNDITSTPIARQACFLLDSCRARSFVVLSGRIFHHFQRRTPRESQQQKPRLRYSPSFCNQDPVTLTHDSSLQ